jgi:hypothetical protein
VNKLGFLPVTGVLLATILSVAACGPSTTAADTGATAPASSATAGDSPGQAMSPTPSASAPAGQAAFAGALAQWKSAAAANAATMNMYLLQAADDLRGSGYPGSGTAVDQLTYLASLPPTNNTPAQQANAHADVQALDSFFGTPGLMS